MLKCRVMRSTRSRSRPRGPAQTGTVGPFVLSELGKNHKDCAHQSGYYWADDIQKVQTHLCDEVDVRWCLWTEGLAMARPSLRPRRQHPCSRARRACRRRAVTPGGSAGGTHSSKCACPVRFTLQFCPFCEPGSRY